MQLEYAPWVAKHGLSQPYGKCQCGCGSDAPISSKTRKEAGWLRGHPIRYVLMHKGLENAPQENPNPSGLCQCGCGQSAPIADGNNARLGHVKGQPVRFIPGHHVRLREQRPVEDRFWEKVDKRGPDECWGWTGSQAPYGYGEMRIDGRSVRAHRFSYELHNGPISDGLDCLHRCDNPPCTNPNHLFVGTAKDNAADMLAKGRGSKPPVHHGTGGDSTAGKYSNEQARQWREEFAKSNLSMMAFARLHNVTDETMRRILKRITYQDA